MRALVLGSAQCLHADREAVGGPAAEVPMSADALIASLRRHSV
jgi:hypothetical protein